ncbi:alpha-L-fucosidase [Paenibacillus sp. tmac-D7]|uniref:alpha-L-fucosidase n=1 Tax=Paenibacillus sp. tmac-D7 TaxID=2591462 RepID=UPI0011413F79|nr:alpha-L-fucosidase [Paenibacillus sp. tmac-D7]
MFTMPFKKSIGIVLVITLLSIFPYTPRALAITPDEYVQLGFGFFPHYGLNTYTGTVGGEGNPQNYPSTLFAPTDFDANQWVAAAKDAGMEYVIVVAKHRYGWAAWDSAYTTYDIATSSAPNLDIVKAVSDACALYGLKFAIYYNADDRYHFPNGVSGNSTYTEFAKNQLTELLTNYGEVVAVWFDHAKAITNNQAAQLEAHVKSIQPNTLVFFHDDSKSSASDVHVTELVNGDPPVGNDRPWEEAWKLYADYWSFQNNEAPAAPWNNAAYVANKVHYYNKRYASFAVSVPPGPNGKISQAGLDLLHNIGLIPRWKQTDDRSPLITYGGTWESKSNSSYYKSTAKDSSEANAYAEYTFTGTGVRLITKKNSTNGIFDIYIDGNKVATFDAYSPSPIFDVVAYETTSLTNATHTIKMVVTGTKNPNSTGYNSNLDLFEYSVNPPQAPAEDTVIDDTSPSISYSGTWNHVSRATSYGGTISYSNTQNDYAEYSFNGTGVTLYTQKGPGGGKFDIYIDGVLQTTFDSYAASQQSKVKAYDKQDLAPGSHTIKLVVKHTKNANSNNYFCHLDYITFH